MAEIGRAILASALRAARGAGLIGYDNTGSGLTATNAQAALDELAAAGGASPASETQAGVVELATAAETETGTDNTRAIHPAGAAATYYTKTESDGQYKAASALSGHAIQDEGVALTQTGTLDFTGNGVTASHDGTNGKTLVTITGAAVGSATETAEGTVEHATEAEVQAGTTGNLVATAARLKAELDRRAALKADAAQPAWTAPTLLNGWINHGTPNATAGYMKDTLGFVVIKGLVKSGTIGAVAFTLPAGFRPAESHHFITAASGASTGTVVVSVEGNVTINQGNTGYTSFAGIRFKAEA